MDPLRALDYLASPAKNVYHLQRTMTLYYNYSIVVWPSVYILPFYHAPRAYKVISMFIRQRRFHARVSWCSEFLCHYIALHGIICLLPLLSAVMSQWEFPSVWLPGLVRWNNALWPNQIELTLHYASRRWYDFWYLIICFENKAYGMILLHYDRSLQGPYYHKAEG